MASGILIQSPAFGVCRTIFVGENREPERAFLGDDKTGILLFTREEALSLVRLANDCPANIGIKGKRINPACPYEATQLIPGDIYKVESGAGPPRLLAYKGPENYGPIREEEPKTPGGDPFPKYPGLSEKELRAQLLDLFDNINL